MPQVPALEVRHWPLESQQPFGHDVALQTHLPLPSQAWPVAQAVHAPPPAPQVAVPGVRHWLLASQQPFGHDVALQTQAPCALQAWFCAHATHWPPLAPQAEADAVMQAPFMQQPAQLIVPQLQAPLMQVWPAAQVPQASPREPQTVDDCDDCATQRPWPSQQPFGQVVGLQAQRPVAVSQVWPVAQAAHAAPAVPHVVVDWPV